MEMERIEYQRKQEEKLNCIQIMQERENDKLRNQIAIFEANQSMQLQYQHAMKVMESLELEKSMAFDIRKIQEQNKIDAQRRDVEREEENRKNQKKFNAIDIKLENMQSRQGNNSGCFIS
jgi:hypothetical protein